MSHERKTPGAEGQRERLKRFLEFSTDSRAGRCNFGAMVLVSPPGDVCCLAPIAPELRGVEIVSASPARDDGRDYDIWKRPAKSREPRMLKTNLTMSEVLDWLMGQCLHAEAEYVAKGGAWLEDALRFYGATPARDH